MASEIPGMPPIRVVEGMTYDCMAHSDFLIAKSGTATLEAAILGTPMVIVYRGTPMMRFEFLFRKSILEEFIGLPNIIAQRGVCPEFINDDAVAAKVADVALGIMRSDVRMEQMRAELKDIRANSGESGSIRRAAEMSWIWEAWSESVVSSSSNERTLFMLLGTIALLFVARTTPGVVMVWPAPGR